MQAVLVYSEQDGQETFPHEQDPFECGQTMTAWVLVSL
jgi:hypothetical protein